MSNNLELTFASNEDSLSVRKFTVTEQLSGLFVVDITARTELEDLDLETLVGHGASFRILGDTKFSLGGDASDAKLRAWTGVCSHMQQVQGEDDRAQSTYALRIVPALWRTTLRHEHPHLPAPELARHRQGRC